MFRCLILAIGLAACGGSAESEPPSAPEASAETPAAVEHAPEGVEPGSHADWCGEHGVPESQCTRCHPELIPAFKATGDWCSEHGLPESQCTACDPELEIVRPPKDG